MCDVNNFHRISLTSNVSKVLCMVVKCGRRGRCDCRGLRFQEQRVSMYQMLTFLCCWDRWKWSSSQVDVGCIHSFF